MLPYILGGTLAILAVVLFGLSKALKLAGCSAPDRRRAVRSGAVLLVTWFFTALLPSWLGLYRRTSSRTPAIQFGVMIPILVGVALFMRWRALRSVLEAVPQDWIVGVQVYRAMGLIFLMLYAGGRLPGLFAWPASVGGHSCRAACSAIAIAYARRSSNAAGWLRAWNLFGIGDLIVGPGNRFLTSPSRLQMFAFEGQMNSSAPSL
jgi:hypothetical protein